MLSHYTIHSFINIISIMKHLLILFAVLLYSNSYSQDIGERLSRIGKDYAIKYLEPFNNGLGTNLNSGFFNDGGSRYNISVPVRPTFNISIRFFGTFFSKSDQSFNTTYIDTALKSGQRIPVNYTVTNAPTAIGSTSPGTAIGTYQLGGITYFDTVSTIGSVVNSTFVPLFVPQLTVGGIFGTDFTIRYLPKIDFGEYGKFSFYGFAIRHNLSSFIKNIPFDLSVQGGYQKLNVYDTKNADVLNSNSYFINLSASKSLASVIIGYAGLQYEKFSTNVAYTYHNASTNTDYPIAFTIDGDNNFRGIAGLTVLLGPVKFNADLNLGKKLAISSGLGVGF